MGILVWIIVGLVVGILAKIAMPGPDPGGVILPIIVGIAGAVLAGYLAGRFLSGSGTSSFDLPSVLVATLGSVILLTIYRFITRRAPA